MHFRTVQAGHIMRHAVGVQRRSQYDIATGVEELACFLNLGQNAFAQQRVLHHCERRVHEAHMHGSGGAEQGHRTQCVSTEEIGPVSAIQRLNVALKQFEDPPVLLNHQDAGRTLTEGLQPHGPDTRKEVDHDSTLEVPSQHVEDRLFGTFCPGTSRPGIRWRRQPP